MDYRGAECLLSSAVPELIWNVGDCGCVERDDPCSSHATRKVAIVEVAAGHDDTCFAVDFGPRFAPGC